MEIVGLRRCCRSSCRVLALHLGRGDDADRTPACRGRRGRGEQSGDLDLGVEDGAADPDLAGEVSGEGEMVPRVGHDLDDRPERSIGTGGKSHRGVVDSTSSVEDESDDQEHREQYRSDDECHGRSK